VNEVVTIGTAMAGGITAWVVWPCAIPLRICLAIVEVLRLSCRQDSAGGALLDDTVQRLLARVRVPVAQQFSTAIRECTTATVEHS
jgi:hypothetical protein